MRGRNYNGLGGFSSHASSMISSIKNNLKARNIDHFKASKISATYKKGKIDKKASPELLKRIREKTRRENKLQLIKNLAVVTAIALTFFLIIWFS